MTAPTRRVLLQLDCDPQPSAFDAIVAVDAGVDVLLPYGGVSPQTVLPLVHGAMFTRGGAALSQTAIFVGGSNVEMAEAVCTAVAQAFFGPVRVSVMLDPAGANTTASAAVLAAARHLPLFDQQHAGRCRALVLGGTGPVGQRVARLLGRLGVAVDVASRKLQRAEEVCAGIVEKVPHARLAPVANASTAFYAALEGADLVVSCGAAGVVLLDAAGRKRAGKARVLIDLNAVPPAGIEGIGSGDKAKPAEQALVYGALGVGGTKMKIHRAGIEKLFGAESVMLDAEELLALGESLTAPTAC